MATPADNRRRLGDITALADRFAAAGWRRAGQVLRDVRAVPTRFIQYDCENGIGGHPTGLVVTLHGPSNEGKSKFLLGLGASLIERGHIFGLADAERTTSPQFTRLCMGRHADSERFLALPVGSYEQVRDGCRRFCETIAEGRIRGELPPDTVGVFGVDSVRKLMPKKLWDEMQKAMAADDAASKPKPKFGRKQAGPKLGNRANQIKAQFNAIWLDELVPLLADTQCGAVLIAREYKRADGGMFDDDFVVGGGDAINYDSSIRIRVVRSFIREGEGETSRVVGERHRLEIRKTKVAGKRQAVPVAYFHTSNGTAWPEGWDRPRDVLELGESAGMIQVSGSWYSWEKKRLGQGKLNTLKRMHTDPDLLDAIERDIRQWMGARHQEQHAAAADL